MSTSTATSLSLVLGGFGLICVVVFFFPIFFDGISPSLPFSQLPLSSPSVTQTNSRPQGSRRRQKGSDYASTSDEEYDSNQSTPKHKRSQPSSASHSPRHQARPQPVVALRPKPRSRDSEDENNEGEAYNNWTNHSSEIAR